MKKTEKRSYTVEYWACLNEDHRHKTSEKAQKCIDTTIEKQNAIPEPKNVWTKEKYAEALEIYKSGGITKTDLGKKYNVTVSRMIMILKKAEILEKYGDRYDNNGRYIFTSEE